ncbi:MAG: DinB family protein [Acidobacteria bacterium]|nr:DinB family protein [Acidobacteriota bacterium]
MKRRSMLAAIGASQVAVAQTWSDPFAKRWREAFLEHWKDTREYTLAVLEAMPDDGFASKPHPVQRTFGEQLNHLALANAAYFTQFGLAPAPARPTETDKASVRKYVTATFDYVLAVLEKMTEKDMMRTDMMVGKKPHSAIDICMRAYMHSAHHRGQVIVYLRVKGITPPAWKFEPHA